MPNTQRSGTRAPARAWQFARRHPRLTVYSAITLLFAVWVLWMYVSAIEEERYERSPEGKAESARREAASNAQADRMVEQTMLDANLAAVKVSLRDPDSAQFTMVRRFQRAGKAVTCGFVNSRNGFGGMSGPRGFVVMDDTQFLFADYGVRAQKIIEKNCS